MRSAPPLHPPLAAFPLALWATSVGWDLLAVARPAEEQWRLLAFWCLAAGLVAAVPAMLAGLLDYWRLPAAGNVARTATLHLVAMAGAATLFAGSLFVRRPRGVSFAAAAEAPPRGAALVFSLGGLVLLAVGGWLGGRLVFRHGVGVEGTTGSHASELAVGPGDEDDPRD